MITRRKHRHVFKCTGTELSIENDGLSHEENHVYVDTHLYQVYTFRMFFDLNEQE